MKIYVIYPFVTDDNKPNAYDWFREEALKLDIELEILFAEKFRLLSNYENSILYDNDVLEVPDIAIIRCYDNILAKHLENMGVRVINSSDSLELAKNKMLSHQILAKNHIPTPKTIYNIAQNYRYQELTEFFGNNKVILKEVEGSKGECVHLVSSQKELDKVMKTAKTPMLAQEFIASSFGRDIRVWVIGNKVVGAALRQSNSDFRSNFSLGGSVQEITLDEKAKKLALDSAKSLALEFAGVDLMFLENDYIVCEVNGNAGFRSLSAISSDTNMIQILLKYIKEN
ncbi:MAG: RimK family alpha-L-glutamate ligase [Rikenellaceae bacterium]